MNRTTIAMVGLLLVAAWLWSPVVGAAHVEGFSAAIEAIARHLNAGTLPSFDTVYPLDTEFYLLSRLGTELAVAQLTRLFGGSSDLAVHVLMVLSLALLVTATFDFARQHTNAPPALVLFVLVIFPGIGESAFIINDNLASAALTALALAILTRTTRWPAIVASGVLLGASLLARTDAIMLVPAIMLLVLRKDGLSWPLLGKLAVGAGLAVALVVAAYGSFGLTPFDTMRVLNHSVVIKDHYIEFLPALAEAAYFLGVPIAVLLILGVVQLALGRNWLRVALFVGVPLLFVIVYGASLWQARQYLPIAPLIVVTAIEGAQRLWTVIGNSRPAIAAVLVLLAVFTLVPAPLVYSDGPRSIAARLWSPPIWWQWQATVRRDFAELNAAIAAAPQGESIVVTDDWNADRYFHLSLLTAGFVAAPDTACRQGTDMFERDGVVIHHVRLHLPFVPGRLPGRSALFDRYLPQCLDALPNARITYVATGPDLVIALNREPAPELPPAPWTPPWFSSLRLSPLTAIVVTREELTRLRYLYDRQLANFDLEPATQAQIDDALPLLQAQTSLLRPR